MSRLIFTFCLLFALNSNASEDLKKDVFNFINNSFESKSFDSDFEFIEYKYINFESDFDINSINVENFKINLNFIDEIEMPDFNLSKKEIEFSDYEMVNDIIIKANNERINEQFEVLKKIPLSKTKYSKLIKSDLKGDVDLFIKYEKPSGFVVTFEQLIVRTFLDEDEVDISTLSERINLVKKFNNIESKEKFLPEGSIYIPFNVF